MTITIDNNKKEYLLNGLFYETPDEDLVTATFAQSIYSCLFNDDLVITGKDTTIEIQKVDGLEAAALNSMLLVKQW
jgi:2-hydroxychromene-2-carboxylate isomerase